MKKIDRTGECSYNSKNELMKIIEYNNCSDIIVEFQDESCLKLHTNYAAFKKGLYVTLNTVKFFKNINDWEK